MRKSKFEFAHKIVDPTNAMAVKSALKREPFYSPESSITLVNYFFMREFLQRMVKEESDLVIRGGNSLPMYTKPFRIPTDIDVSTSSPENIYQLVRHIGNTGDDVVWKIGDKSVTTNGILQTRIEADLHGFRGGFSIDVEPAQNKASAVHTMKKVISTDELFNAKALPLDEAVASKIDSLFNKLNREGRPKYYRVKDFYDIYMLCQDGKVNPRAINDYWNSMIPPDMRDKFKRTRDGLDQITGPTLEHNWGIYKTKNNTPDSVDVNKVMTSVKNLIGEMEI